MTNDYICLELKSAKKGRGGSFVAVASFQLDNIPVIFDSVDVKIDTGCSISTVPLRRYKIHEKLCMALKEQDIRRNIDYVISYGVETGGLKHSSPQTFQDKLDCAAMKFLHKVSNFSIEGIKVDIKDIYVNYNRSGSALIGMDILEKLDIHIGTSRLNGKQLLIACPKENITESYLYALDQHFGLVGM